MPHPQCRGASSILFLMSCTPHALRPLNEPPLFPPHRKNKKNPSDTNCLHTISSISYLRILNIYIFIYLFMYILIIFIYILFTYHISNQNFNHPEENGMVKILWLWLWMGEALFFSVVAFIWEGFIAPKISLIFPFSNVVSLALECRRPLISIILFLLALFFITPI